MPPGSRKTVLIHVSEPLDVRQCLAPGGSERISAIKESEATLGRTGGKNVAIRTKRKKAYVAPRVVDFGAIEAMTGDCLGLCVDGEHFGWFGIYP